MTKKNALYTAGTVVCVVVIGGIAFYLNKSNSAPASPADQAPLSQTASEQTASEQPQQVANEASPSQSPTNINPSNSAPDGNGAAKRGPMANIPSGQKPFFGQVASVSGSTLTITTHTMNRGASSPEGSSASSASPTTITVTLTSSTTFSGGTESTLASGVRIFGYGTPNSDGSITATNIQINPTRPTGAGSNANGQ